MGFFIWYLDPRRPAKQQYRLALSEGETLRVKADLERAGCVIQVIEALTSRDEPANRAVPPQAPHP